MSEVAVLRDGTEVDVTPQDLGYGRRSDADEPSVLQWLQAVILHIEAVYGCEHTEQAREAAGMLPRNWTP